MWNWMHSSAGRVLNIHKVLGSTPVLHKARHGGPHLPPQQLRENRKVKVTLIYIKEFEAMLDCMKPKTVNNN